MAQALIDSQLTAEMVVINCNFGKYYHYFMKPNPSPTFS
jgi:hypothetical protein